MQRLGKYLLLGKLQLPDQIEIQIILSFKPWPNDVKFYFPVIEIKFRERELEGASDYYKRN